MIKRHFSQRLLIHVLGALVLASLLILPDYLYQLTQATYQVGVSLKAFAAFWLVAMLLLGLRYPLTFLVILVFFALFQLAQFLHFSFFGSLISPHEVIFMFSEWGEIWQTLSAVLPHMAYPLLVVAIVNALAWLLWKRLHAAALRLPLAGLVLVLIFAILPYRAYHSPKSQGFYPTPAETSLRNTLFAVSFFIGRGLSSEEEPARPTFQPYRLESLPFHDAPIIVVVMGESLTYKHMSLFGYDRKTTPELEKLRGDPNFVFHRAIAGGVATKVSLPAFYNVQREPGFVGHLLRYESNLLKMAKTRGMRTYYITAQTPNLATYAGTEFADEFISQDDMQPLYDEIKDDVLLRQLARIDLTKPAFIVLHQRNSHSPYEESHPAGFDKYPIQGLSHHDYMNNSYDNSIMYTDNLIARIIGDLKARSKRPVYLFFTSDHGEMMGEGGKYGHTMLEPDVARVPFIFYSHGGEASVVRQVRAMQAPTHYEIGKTIAHLLGYRVINPNEVSGRFYVNGPDLGGRMGCMAIDKVPSEPYGWRLTADSVCPEATEAAH